MTEQRHCYENSKAERVNGILKNEYYIDAVYPSKAMARKNIEEAIRIYNTRRIHDALGGMTPVQYRQKFCA